MSPCTLSLLAAAALLSYSGVSYRTAALLAPVLAGGAAPPRAGGWAEVAACDGFARQNFTLDAATGQLKSGLDGTCLDGTCGDPAGHGCYPLLFVPCEASSTAQRWHYDAAGGGRIVSGAAGGP